MTAPLFTGEAMLLSWGDTSSRGKTVTFQLHEDDCGQTHPFRDLGTGKHGQRFRLIAQPIGDDDLPLVPEAPIPGSAKSDSSTINEGPFRVTDQPPNAPQRVETSGTASGRSYTLANRIGMLCGDRAFQQWATKASNSGEPLDEAMTAAWVRLRCGVETRAEIRPGTEASRKWNEIALAFEAATNRMAEERR